MHKAEDFGVSVQHQSEVHINCEKKNIIIKRRVSSANQGLFSFKYVLIKYFLYMLNRILYIYAFCSVIEKKEAFHLFCLLSMSIDFSGHLQKIDTRKIYILLCIYTLFSLIQYFCVAKHQYHLNCV